MAKEKMLDISFDVSDAVPETIITDRLRLEQILKNLLSNALKFTKKGFISVRVETDLKNNNWVLFKVKDSGIGIPKEKRDHIFGAFQQADGSTRRKFGGTGLGLSISRELAKLLGGTLIINDEVNEGSEFILRIPIDGSQPKKEDSTIQETELPPIMPKPVVIEEEKEERFLSTIIPDEIPDDRDHILPEDKVILIIEDDTSFAKALKKFSKKKGYKCIIAVRGDKGIELANQFQPHGILLDLQLPIKDGWQVMEELKKNPATKHIPVHMMSSYEIKHESLMKGAINFISKPIAFEQMNEIFNKLEAIFHKDTKKVLIVEENIKHAKALSYYLESFDIKVEIKKNIDDSIDALSNNKIDCVILDMGVPDAVAYRTLESVKEEPGLEGLPIIVFTGKNLSKIEEQKIKQYANTIVVKTAHSYERILDEVALFLHLVEQNKVTEEQPVKSKLLNKFSETLTGKTVLVADDDIRNIFSLTKVLENHGMDVLTASDGKEALKVLEENSDKVDIVLMDMMMPEMDGYETISRIRKDPKLSYLPVLAVTAKAMMGDREKCIEAGASDYISKPVDSNQLISLLRVWLYN
jgi:CheY-like chemotaxis protein